MGRFREKTQPFIMGLMLGLLIAGGFFILKLDNYFKELNFYKSLVHTFTSETKVSETADNNKEDNSSKENTSVTTSAQHKFTLGNDSAETSLAKSGPAGDVDSVNTSSNSSDSLITNEETQDEIVVRKDELLSTKTLEVINLNPASAKANSKDSLLQKVSGVQDDKNNKQLLNIEFWQSPINYKGYRMSKYKIVLYGIVAADGLKLFKSEDGIYLKNQGAVYKLDYASELKPYEKISDESILARLK